MSLKITRSSEKSLGVAPVAWHKRSCLPWSSGAFWKFFSCKFYRKSSGRNSTICVFKDEAVSYEIQTHLGSFYLASFVKKALGTFLRFICPKTKLFSVKFRRKLEVVALQGLWKKLRAHYHDLCIQKWNCLLWSLETFRKFSVCKVYRESSGQIFMIYVSINEAVCCEVQTHFGRFPLARW